MRLRLWIAAVTIWSVGPIVYFALPGLGYSHAEEWNVEPRHLAERCGLFIILALGESILVMGATFADQAWTAARLLGLGPLGLFEMQRARIHPPLHEVLGWPPSPLTHGLVALRRAAREVAANPGRRFALRAAPAVLAALEGLPGALDEFAAAAGRPLVPCPDPRRFPGDEVIKESTDGG